MILEEKHRKAIIHSKLIFWLAHTGKSPHERWKQRNKPSSSIIVNFDCWVFDGYYAIIKKIMWFSYHLSEFQFLWSYCVFNPLFYTCIPILSFVLSYSCFVTWVVWVHDPPLEPNLLWIGLENHWIIQNFFIKTALLTMH